MQALLAPILGPSSPYTADLSGKPAVIAGGALGIVFETSKWFAKMGARVIMVNRKEEKGGSAIGEIKAECITEGKSAEVEWIGCDLGDVKMMKEVFSGIREKVDRLDLMYNDGVDRHFGVTALGHYYVINRLYPLLRRASQKPDVRKGSVRIVFESSEMHRAAPGSQDSKTRGRGVHFGSEEEITEGAKEYSPMELYGRIKPAMILYTKALRDKGKLGGESAQGKDLNLATALWELSERMIERLGGEDALQAWS